MSLIDFMFVLQDGFNRIRFEFVGQLLYLSDVDVEVWLSNLSRSD